MGALSLTEYKEAEPPKVGVPMQTACSSSAKLDGSPKYWTTAPGWGKRISPPSLAVQSWKLVTKMGGKLEDRFSANRASFSLEHLAEPLITLAWISIDNNLRAILRSMEV